MDKDNAPHTQGETQQDTHHEHKESHGVMGWVNENKGFVSLMTAMGIALLIKFFILSPYGIPSPSMVPTLNVGDVAVANKLDDEPERGDIIIFKGNDVWGSDKDYIKRVIGVPGDTVGGCTPDGSLMVNGEPLWEDYLQDDSGCNFPTITVPDNTVWVMGDNRGNSADSRYHSIDATNGTFSTKGAVPMDSIIGTMQFSYRPLFGMGTVFF